MSGAKRRSGYRKGVKMLMDDFEEPSEDQTLGEILGARGGLYFDVVDESGEEGIAQLPLKYHNLIFIRRGWYVLMEKASEDYETRDGTPGKVKFAIVLPLTSDHIKHLKEIGRWPASFVESTITERKVEKKVDEEDDFDYFGDGDKEEEEAEEED